MYEAEGQGSPGCVYIYETQLPVRKNGYTTTMCIPAADARTPTESHHLFSSLFLELLHFKRKKMGIETSQKMWKNNFQALFNIFWR